MTYDIIIVGGGPGGIASAVEASIFKIKNILLIEKGENHSQTIRKYYKESKRVDKIWKKQEIELLGNVDFFDGTKESTIDYFEVLLKNKAINTLYNTEVDKVIKNKDIFEVVTNNQSYYSKNVIVSIGRMGKPNKPSYKIPSTIRKIVNHNPYDCKGNEKILVVGGGDSAVEYACQLSIDNDIELSYRRDAFMRINDINKEMISRYTHEGKVNVLYSTDIESIEKDEKGIKVNFTNTNPNIYDRVIYALGGTTPFEFFYKSNIDVDDKKKAIFNSNFETSVEGLYLVGDIIYNNGGSIAMAINHAYEVMQEIIEKD